MRTIEVFNPALKKILAERGKVVDEARKLQKEVDKLQREQQKLGYKMDNLRDKTTPFIEDLTPSFNLREFELVGRVYLDKDVIKVDIVDQVEEYTRLLREKIEGAKKKQDAQS
jgi:hypothetical protein